MSEKKRVESCWRGEREKGLEPIDLKNRASEGPSIDRREKKKNSTSARLHQKKKKKKKLRQEAARRPPAHRRGRHLPLPEHGRLFSALPREPHGTEIRPDDDVERGRRRRSSWGGRGGSRGNSGVRSSSSSRGEQQQQQRRPTAAAAIGPSGHQGRPRAHLRLRLRRRRGALALVQEGGTLRVRAVFAAAAGVPRGVAAQRRRNGSEVILNPFLSLRFVN